MKVVNVLYMHYGTLRVLICQHLFFSDSGTERNQTTPKNERLLLLL